MPEAMEDAAPRMKGKSVDTWNKPGKLGQEEERALKTVTFLQSEFSPSKIFGLFF